MAITTAQKAQILKDYQRAAADTRSPEVQIALLSARCLLGAAAHARLGVLDRAGAVAWSLIGVVVALGTLVGLMSLSGGHLANRPPLLLWGGAWIALVTTGIGLCIHAWRGAYLRASWFGLAHIIVVGASLLGLVLPLQTDDLWLTRKLTAWIATVDAARSRPLAAVGYQEDSLVFQTRGRVQRLTEPALAVWLAENPTGLVVLPAEAVERFPSLRPAGFDRPHAVAAFNYARGRKEAVVVAETRR